MKKKGLLSAASNSIDKLRFGIYLTGEFKDLDKLDFLDANKCLMLSCNYAEEAICLDFRFSIKNPRIMASDFSKKNGRWVEIVGCVDELIEKLEIKENPVIIK